jgi:hypothetical protein
VRLLVGVEERRLLEREHRGDADEGEEDADEAEQRRGDPPARAEATGGLSVAVTVIVRLGGSRRFGDQLGGADASNRSEPSSRVRRDRGRYASIAARTSAT